MANKSFLDFYNDDANVPPTERAKIEFEVEFIGKLIAAREAKGMTQEQLPEAVGGKQSTLPRL
jgi:DNA-binding XRE family transcriptional regulator